VVAQKPLRRTVHKWLILRSLRFENLVAQKQMFLGRQALRFALFAATVVLLLITMATLAGAQGMPMGSTGKAPPKWTVVQKATNHCTQQRAVRLPD
jgi:hypothetical protein